MPVSLETLFFWWLPQSVLLQVTWPYRRQSNYRNLLPSFALPWNFQPFLETPFSEFLFISAVQRTFQMPTHWDGPDTVSKHRLKFPSGNSQGLCSVNPQCYQLGVQLPKSQHFPGRNSEWHTLPHPLSTKGYFCSIDVSFKQFNCEISLKMSKTMPQVLDNAGSFLAARCDKVIITVPTKGYFAFCFSWWFPGSSD